jgi:hypothetical protein
MTQLQSFRMIWMRPKLGMLGLSCFVREETGLAVLS